MNSAIRVRLVVAFVLSSMANVGLAAADSAQPALPPQPNIHPVGNSGRRRKIYAMHPRHGGSTGQKEFASRPDLWRLERETDL
jgi:hypothetical protein